MNKFTRILIKFKNNKRFSVILLFVVLLVLIVAGLFFLSQKAWDDYTIKNDKYFENSKADIDSAMSQIPIESKLSLSDKLSIIVQVQSKLKADVDKFCDVNMMIKWQSFVEQYSDKIDKCASKKGDLNEYLLKLSVITDYLANEQELSKIISTANEATNQNNQIDKWGLVEPFWRQASSDTSKLADIEQFGEVKTLAIQKINNIGDAWLQLVNANNAKDRQKFQESQTNLTNTYASIVEIGNNSKLQVEKMTADLAINHEEVF